MLSTRALLLLLFPVAVFPVDNLSPIRRAAFLGQCTEPLPKEHTLAPKALLAANPTVISLIVKDNLAGYLVGVSIGSPPRNQTLSIDTGSANFIIGQRKYAPTSSGMNTTQPVHQTYHDGTNLNGFEFIDTISVGCVTLNQSIGVTDYADGETDGILGIGPTQLTKGSLTNETGQYIPTFVDNLASQGIIPSRAVGFTFKPWNESDSNKLTGEITLGGIDQSRFVEPLIYVPITKTQPANSSVGIDASIFYNNKPLLSNGAGIIDTGVTNLVLAADVFDAYTNATGVKRGRGYSFISAKDYENLQPLVFVIGNFTFTLTPDAQRFPPSVERKYFNGNTAQSSTILITPTNYSSGNGIDFILGMPWLRRFYHVYDPDNGQKHAETEADRLKYEDYA